MPKQNTKLTTVGELLSLNNDNFGVANPPLIAAPNSAITDMSGAVRRLPDPSKTLKPTMGIERIMTQQIVRLQDERGPNGEPVFAAVNDDSQRIRFVGNCSNNVFSQGQYIQLNSSGDYVEVTFYGTGLNILMLLNGLSRNIVASVDGGSEGSNLWAGYSGVLDTRNYSMNCVLPVASSLTLGLHTVRIRNNGSGTAPAVYGFEIIGPATISVPQGEIIANGLKYTNPAAQSFAHNTGFDGSPALNGRGGRVLVYALPNGIQGKVIQQVDAAAAFLTSANHANEEVARTYNFREFGAGRADDFSLVAGAATNRVFTLDDGTTTLASNSFTVLNEIPLITNNSFITFTFVGSGLDIVRQEIVNATTTNVHTVFVDGVSVGTLSNILSTQKRTVRIVSGLPYGTHTVRIAKDAPGDSSVGMTDFIVYQPKTPSIPTGAKAIAAYNVMANFTANSTAGTDRISTGILRKNPSREMVYVNGTGGTTDWTASLDLNAPGGFELRTDRTNGYFEYTFFGTGFDFRFSSASNRSANISVTLNGLAATVVNYPSLTSSVYGTGVAFASGTLDMQDAASTNGSGLVISGLPLARYTVRFNNNTASANIINNAFDVITPIHSPKSNLYASLQNTLPVGSNSMSWSSKFATANLTANKAWAQAVGITVSPTTTSTAFVPMPDMSVTIKTNGGPLEISYSANVHNNTGGWDVSAAIYVNGAIVPGTTSNMTSSAPTYRSTLSRLVRVPVSAGVHKVDVYWFVNGNTGTTDSINRILTVKEV